MNHPLTNDISEEISVSYLKNCESVKSNMRSAADWQLEQVVSYLDNYKDPTWHILLTDEFHTIIHDLKEAMRPQEDDS